jgi:hypothetical protein
MKDNKSIILESQSKQDNELSAHPTENQPLFQVSHQIINKTVDIFPTKL